jgi:lysophospholipase L1-like esterase
MKKILVSLVLLSIPVGYFTWWSNKVDDELFIIDGLHLSGAGYTRWTERIRPQLTALVPGASSLAAQGE